MFKQNLKKRLFANVFLQRSGLEQKQCYLGGGGSMELFKTHLYPQLFSKHTLNYCSPRICQKFIFRAKIMPFWTFCKGWRNFRYAYMPTVIDGTKTQISIPANAVVPRYKVFDGIRLSDRYIEGNVIARKRISSL